MSLLVSDITYEQAIRAIREIILDTNPVQCFKVSGQDFLFSKNSTDIALDTQNFQFSDVEKYYDLMDKLRDKDVSIEILPDYIATEWTENTVNFNYPTIKDGKTISRKNYFSIGTIEAVMEEFYAYYTPYDGVPKTVRSIFDMLDYFSRRKLILWVAYYLVDRKRMYYASAGEMIRMQNSSDGAGDGCSSEGEIKNTETTITTRVGEVFSVTERTVEDGKGMDGFTSLWGDKYSYFTKLQLWIRDRFEKQFKDFTLRDDAMICSTFTLDKGWEPFAWVDTINYSRDTYDILHPNR